MTSERQMQELGAFVHGVLAAFHGLGALYNLRRRNHTDVFIHMAALAYDVHATIKHWKEARA